MNRFDVDPKEVEARTRAISEDVDRQKASSDGDAVTSSKEQASDTSPDDQHDSMQFKFRMAFTFTEDDPIGKALAERIRSLPEGESENYNTTKVFRRAIFNNLPYLAKKM